MHLRALAADRAVSPVIGIVLMVAITVILAAVVGTFALALGTGEAPPQARFGYEPIELSGQPDELRITHEGGDPIVNTELYVRIEGGVQDESGAVGPADRLSWYEISIDNGGTAGTSVTAGESLLVEPPNSSPEIEGKEVRLVWDSGESSATLSRWTTSD